MEVTKPITGYGSGYGSGYGDGYGNGNGNGDGNGYGYGDGYGDGSGYGDGYGDGNGYGYGDGYGNGNGNGDGSGYGDGDGYGYGYGNGNGNGDGYGNGNGNGNGNGEYIKQICLKELGDTTAAFIKDGAILAYWNSKSDGRPANGGKGPARHCSMDEQIEGPLEMCGPGALHATFSPQAWSGEKTWIVAMYPPIKVDTNKIGSLRRVIVQEAIQWWKK